MPSGETASFQRKGSLLATLARMIDLTRTASNVSVRFLYVDGDECGSADQKFCGRYCCADRIIFAPFIDADPPRLLTLMGAIDYIYSR